MARLKNNDTFPALAASFSVGLGSAWRYADEVITILAGQAPGLVAVLDQVGKDDTLLIDGTLIRTDRVAAEGFYSGKHKCQGVNVQAISDVYGNPLWLSPAIGGAAHDMAAVREHNLEKLLEGFLVLGDLGYVGTPWVVPIKKPRWRELTEVEKACNVAHSQVRCAVERVFAKLKSWKCLSRFRSSPGKATAAVAAVGVLIRMIAKSA